MPEEKPQTLEEKVEWLMKRELWLTQAIDETKIVTRDLISLVPDKALKRQMRETLFMFTNKLKGRE